MKVFISYAREDWEIAEKVRSDLKQAGIDAWIDRKELLPGQNWKTEISTAIRASSHFIALLSTRSVSKQGFFQTELKKAIDVLDTFPEQKIYFIPVRIDDCEPGYERLGDIHWADLFPSYEDGLKQLLRVLDSDNELLEIINHIGKSDKKTIQKCESERSVHIQGNIEKSIINSGDNNILKFFTIHKQHEQSNPKLPTGFMPLIILLTIATVSITLILILFGYFFAETKQNLDFFQIIIAIIIAVAGICSLIFVLSNAFKIIHNIKIVIIILIPLCIAVSVVSASLLLDKPIAEIIERILFQNNKEKQDEREFKLPEPDHGNKNSNKEENKEVAISKPDSSLNKEDAIKKEERSGEDIPPIARDDFFSFGGKNEPIKLNILANDVGEKLKSTITAIPSYGSLADNGDGSYTYKPAIDYVGNDSFSYMIEDYKGRKATANVSISINSSSSVEPRPDTFSTRENELLVINYDQLTSNDSNPNRYPLTVDIKPLVTPKHGTLTDDPINKRVIYQPDPYFYGKDTFYYSITGPNGKVSYSTVTIDVVGSPPPMLNAPATITIQQGGILSLSSVHLPFTNNTATSVSIKISGMPQDSILSKGIKISDGSWVLTPDQMTEATLAPPVHFSGNFNLTIEVKIIRDNGDSAITQKTIACTVSPTH